VRLLSITAALATATSAAPARAQLDGAAEIPQAVGDSEAALPGIGRVGVATPMRRGAAVSAFAGYGFTGAVLGIDDSHHRAAGQLGLTLRLTEWLGFGARLDGRYDRHSFTTAAGDESDDGLVGDPRVVVRAAGRVSSMLGVGAQINLWFPGGDAPDLDPAATSVEAQVIGSLIPEGKPYALSLNAGFRLDNSAKTVDHADALSLADRMALGASDSNAVLLGLGGSYRAGPVELLGEATYDLLIGADAPPAAESPLEVGAGLRVHLAESLQLQAMARARVSSDPEIALMQPLVPVSPRFSAMAGLHIQFGGPDRAETGPLVTDNDREEVPDDRPVEPAGLTGRVVSGGAPLSDARVTITGPGVDLEATTDGEGKFKLEGIDGKAGRLVVAVSLDGFESAEVEVPVVAGQVVQRDIELERILPPGQIRGVIRDFRGRPVRAEVTIVPIDKKVTADADGVFTVEVPPGDYEVVVEHKGYAPQRREAKVDEKQVTILNIDLEKP
jgi:hypothetical protein